ncbi:MAG TPA: glycosyltransferase [Thermomicrobiales bacterium]|nr:glycosyltransferase [Thermomicrobiales bacterium]
MSTPLVVICSQRLGGRDGVAIEAAKWAWAFRRLGWRTRRVAGHFAGPGEAGDVRLAALWADEPGGPCPPVEPGAVAAALAGVDLLVLDNAATLPSAPAAALALVDTALRAGVPLVLRHHDPGWQYPGRPDRPDFPLDPPGATHVAISAVVADGLARRRGIRATVLHNRVDTAALAAGERRATRAVAGVGDDELLVVHPVRAVARKNIPAAVALCGALERRLGRPVRYWLTAPDDAGRYPTDLLAGLCHPPILGTVERAADLYAAADLVAYPSRWEGFGNPPVEAAAAGRLTAAGRYPARAELARLGLRCADADDPAGIAALLADPAALAALTVANRRAVEAHLALRDLPEELACAVLPARVAASLPG